jgi:hypothetical protein
LARFSRCLAEEESVQKGAATVHKFREGFAVKEAVLVQVVQQKFEQRFCGLWHIFRGDIAAVINDEFIVVVNSEFS